jgi:REP element-mobilizing transposase RayT
MRHSYTCIWIHIIWATKNRERILHASRGEELFHFFIDEGNEIKIPFEKLNVQPEHIHALINLPSSWSLKDYMKRIKGSSSHWLNSEIFQSKFSWQRGYGAYSVSASQLEKVKSYIAGQTEHHKRTSFNEEYEEWKREYGILDD